LLDEARTLSTRYINRNKCCAKGALFAVRLSRKASACWHEPLNGSATVQLHREILLKRM
jgi:hypothetical protein